MGTSASHSGAKSNISFDPPWLNDEVDTIQRLNPSEINLTPSDEKIANVKILLAPAERFKIARTELNRYVKTGDRSNLRKALGNYSKTGMGGASRLSYRMSRSASTAASLYNAFSNKNDTTITKMFFDWRNSGENVFVFINKITDYICPTDGALDEISSRDSVNFALSEMFERDPDVDLSNPSDDIIWTLISAFLSHEAFQRVQLDIGQAFENQTSVTSSQKCERLNDMREYLEVEISVHIQRLRDAEKRNTPSELKNIMTSAIRDTFAVFEEDI